MTAPPAVLGWLQARQGEMLTLLETLVNSDSPSRDKAGVDATGEILKRFFAAHDIPVEIEGHEIYGEAIHASVPQAGANDTRPILLMGHRDTVFPPGEAGRRPFKIEGDRAYGPGVADMKAGLVINAFVMAAFKAVGGHPGPLAALITSDEEIASPSSRPIIERVGRESRVVLNGEPGRASGNIVSGRKGSVFMRFAVAGRAAHSGGNFIEGRSAIGELAHKIVALHALTDLEHGITVNVGLVAGGQTVNTVAPSATGEIDLRYVHAADRAFALEKIGAIMDHSTVADTTATWEILGEFLPMEMTPDAQKLMDLYVEVSGEQGFTVGGEFTGGCADSGFTAAQGTPTLCGLGAVGGKAHTVDEYMEVPTLLTRAQALAALIARLGETGL
ncbi:M20 family metallopeptidase [Acidisphaera sp. L21]|uniref:M20 family metallopeptidase n=1 Tax=Acidisphaera sp. L21 TaxID=1641851 RepID=UPI00131E530E|nr:M20 family metallopeptidase [Acidisphaera sp. L21]